MFTLSEHRPSASGLFSLPCSILKSSICGGAEGSWDVQQDYRAWLGKAGSRARQALAAQHSPTTPEQAAFSLWAGSTTGKRTEAPNSLTSPSPAGWPQCHGKHRGAAQGSYQWTTEVLLLRGRCGHFTGHEHQTRSGQRECGA